MRDDIDEQEIMEESTTEDEDDDDEALEAVLSGLDDDTQEWQGGEFPEVGDDDEEEEGEDIPIETSGGRPLPPNDDDYENDDDIPPNPDDFEILEGSGKLLTCMSASISLTFYSARDHPLPSSTRSCICHPSDPSDCNG